MLLASISLRLTGLRYEAVGLQVFNLRKNNSRLSLLVIRYGL